MLSAVIHSAHGYPAFTVGTITGTPEVRSSRSSRTREKSSQYSCAYTGYGPNCLTTFWTQLTYHFNWRTAKPLGPAPAPGCDEPTSRCQTPSSIWTLGGYQPVIPGVPFIRWAMALPLRTTGSLWPSFDSARLVSLAVRQAYAIALYERFLTVLSLPSHASVTFWEATAPVKLPTIQCLAAGLRHAVRCQE